MGTFVRHPTGYLTRAPQLRKTCTLSQLRFALNGKWSVVARAESQSSRKSAKDSQVENQLEFLEVAVPRDQRPSNELQQLKDDMLYSWVRDERILCGEGSPSC